MVVLKKVVILLIVFTILFSLIRCQKEDPLNEIVDDCVISFAKAYLINNFEYNPKTKYYISERLYWSDKKNSKTIQFPCYYFVYDMENILFCVGLYISENNDTGSNTYPYMGKFIYSNLVDETTALIIKETNKYANKIKINSFINLTKIKNVNIYKNPSSQRISETIKELLVEMCRKRISRINYSNDDKFYVKNPIRDYTIVIEDNKNISINEKLIYPLFMNDRLIALYEFKPNGCIACAQKVDMENIYGKAYQISDTFVFIHGGDYPYLKTYCLFGDEKLDTEVLSEMFTDPIFIRTKKEIDKILSELKPYGILFEIQLDIKN